MNTKPKYTDHTISIIARNNPGVITKVAGMINRRGFNVESFTAGKTKDPGISRMTIVIKGDDEGCEQVQKQVSKIIDTVKVAAIQPENRVAREMALIKIKLTRGDKGDLFQLINIYKAKIVDTSPGGIVVEVTGPPEKIDGFINLLPHNLIVGVSRSGVVAMNKLTKQMNE